MSRPASVLARSVATALVLLLAGCDGGSAEPSPTPTPTPTPEATPEFTVTFDEPAYEGPTTPLEGIFTEPRENEVDRRVSLGPEPAPDFPAWDGESVILYDIEAGRTVNLGPGNLGAVPFSSDGTQFIYASGSGEGDERPRVTVYDLETGDSREYGTGYAPSFEGDGTFSVRPEFEGPFGDEDHFDLATGELVFPEDASIQRTDGRIVQTTRGSDHGWMVQTSRGQEAAPRVVLLPPGGSVAFEAEADYAFPALDDSGNPSQVLLLTSPDPEAFPPDELNLFLVGGDGRAEWLATIHNLLLETNAFALGFGYIAWTEDHCDPERGRTYVLDLETSELTEIDRALDLSSGGGDVIALGAAAALRHRAMLDPHTLEYLRVMPGLPAWNAERTWAANGPHGSEWMSTLTLDRDICAALDGASPGVEGTATASP